MIMKTLYELALLTILIVAGPIGCSEKTAAPEISDNDGGDAVDLTGTYVIVDTGQEACYDDQDVIASPSTGEAFYGQDSQHYGAQPSYVISDDGLTVYDVVTGLTWQKSPDRNGDGVINAADKLTWAGCQAYPSTLNASEFGGYSDWRLPTIKEQYSLILFTGIDPSGYTGDASSLVPFIDTDYFDFAYGDESAGERLIDSQYASSNLYVDSGGMMQLLFGVNFADGRIKGYGLMMPGGREKTFLVMCVRDNTSYGINNLVDNGDSTITDNATGLMWEQNDSGGDVPGGLNWEEALARVAALNTAEHLGYSDWRLPNVKELQSILDYSRSPGTTGSAAIDPLFNATSITNEAGQADYPFYWSSTTHAHFLGGNAAAYVSFGRAMGYMEGSWVDVHGAGAQRSDPKSGDPADYPFGNGPQGDAIRIYNCVRVVRDAD
jgi:hypothetical protein